MKKALLALTLILAATSFSQASTCADESTVGMKECMSNDHDKADLDLNRAYQGAMAAARKLDAINADDGGIVGVRPNEVASRLLAAEKAWIQLRDTSCDLEAVEMLGGTGEGLLNLGCLVRKTQERTRELVKFTKLISGR